MPVVSKEEESGIAFTYIKVWYFEGSLYGPILGHGASAIDLNGNDITDTVQDLGGAFYMDKLKWIPEIHEIENAESE